MRNRSSNAMLEPIEEAVMLLPLEGICVMLIYLLLCVFNIRFYLLIKRHIYILVYLKLVLIYR